MLKRACEMPKSEALESLALNGRSISEAAATFCEISYRSYSDKAKRQRRSLQALQGPQKGRDSSSRSMTPESTPDRDVLDKPPLRSRSRLDADGDCSACSSCFCGLLAKGAIRLSAVQCFVHMPKQRLIGSDFCSHGVH